MYKILLVDDEYLVRETLKTILNKQRNIENIGEATSGKSAIEKFDLINPDIVILDTTIPGMSLIDLIKYMKRSNNKTNILLLKDYGSSDIVKKAVASGADASLMKPTRPDELLDLVNKYLPNKQYGIKNLEITIGMLIEYVYNENYKKTMEQVKIVTHEVMLYYKHDRKVLQEAIEHIFTGLQAVCRKKQLSVAKSLSWSKKANRVNLFNFESEITVVIEEIFEEIADTTKFVHDKKLIQSVLNYIERNYQNGVTLDEAAEYVHLSPFYLSKLFKKELKINFVSYVMERKIEKAKDLLKNTDMPIINIAMELNYKEANYFSKVFKKVTGMTPSQYRKQYEKKAENEQQLLKKHYQILNGNWYI